jgi:hypothetical protein
VALDRGRNICRGGFASSSLCHFGEPQRWRRLTRTALVRDLEKIAISFVWPYRRLAENEAGKQAGARVEEPSGSPGGAAAAAPEESKQWASAGPRIERLSTEAAGGGSQPAPGGQHGGGDVGLAPVAAAGGLGDEANGPGECMWVCVCGGGGGGGWSLNKKRV